MGFINTSSDIKLTAKLTPKGRESILNGIDIFKKIAIGDSDANYFEDLTLSNGNIPNVSGSLGDSFVISNSLNNSYKINSNVYLNDLNELYKDISDDNKSNVNQIKLLNNKTLSLSNVDIIELDRTQSDEYNNLMKSFNFPLTPNDYNLFNNTTFNQGGFSNTSIKGFTSDNLVIINIPSIEHSELIDGKKIKLELSGSTYQYTLYSTYQSSSLQLVDLDNELKDPSPISNSFGSNVAFLFSDDIKLPVNGGTWADGFNSKKPFSIGNKKTFVFSSSTNNYDECVGIVFLDKGFIVLVNPDIINDFDTNDLNLSLSFNNYYTTVSKNINVFLNRGEFFKSNNKTFTKGDVIRVSEIGVYNNDNELMAITKPNEHILKQTNQIIGLSIEITV